MKTYAKVGFAAAAILVLAALIGLWDAISPGNPSAVYGQVIERVQAAHSVRFKITSKTNVQGLGPVTTSCQAVMVDNPWRMRMDMDIPLMPGLPGAAPTQMVMIFDYGQKETLTYSLRGDPQKMNPLEKTALRMNMQNVPPEKLQEMEQQNILAQFHQMQAKDTQPIAEKEINGRQYPGFHSNTQGMDMDGWFDPDTKLPILLQGHMRLGNFPDSEVTMDDFVWEAPVDETLFNLTPPEGFTIRDMNIDMSEPTEQDFVAALRTAAEFNHGQFPDELSLQSLMTTITAGVARDIAQDKSPQDQSDIAKEIQDKMMKVGLQITRALRFPGNTKNGSDFHYAGKGVQVGAPEAPIFWYLPKDGAQYHVIDAQLNVQEVAKDALPQVPSVEVGPLMPTTPTPTPTP